MFDVELNSIIQILQIVSKNTTQNITRIKGLCKSALRKGVRICDIFLLVAMEFCLTLRSGRYKINYGLVAVGVTIATLPLMIVFVIFQRQLIRGLTDGAIKG